MNINQTLYLQAEVANEYMRQRGLTPPEFVELDRKYGILHFLEVGYELFHLTGTQGIIEEIDDYLRRRAETPAYHSLHPSGVDASPPAAVPATPLL